MQLLRGGGASARRARRLEADLARNDAQPWARRILKEHLVSAVARRGGLAAVQAAAAAACKLQALGGCQVNWHFQRRQERNEKTTRLELQFLFPNVGSGWDRISPI
jgi:hypothetical protein